MNSIDGFNPRTRERTANMDGMVSSPGITPPPGKTNTMTGKSLPSAQLVSVNVVNGSGTSGQAEQVANGLQSSLTVARRTAVAQQRVVHPQAALHHRVR